MDKPCLLECSVCGGKVSSAAKSCPHCGQPMNESALVKRFKAAADHARATASEVKGAVYEGIVDNPERTFRGYVVSAWGHIAMTWLIAFLIVFVFGSIGLTMVGSMALLTAGFMTAKMIPSRARYEEDLVREKSLESTINDEPEFEDSERPSYEEKAVCDICEKREGNRQVVLKIERRKTFDWSRKEIHVAVCDECQSEIRSRPMRIFKFFLKSLILCFFICVSAFYVFAFVIKLQENVHTIAFAGGSFACIFVTAITMILVNPNRGKLSYMDARQMRKLEPDAWEVVDVKE